MHTSVVRTQQSSPLMMTTSQAMRPAHTSVVRTQPHTSVIRTTQQTLPMMMTTTTTGGAGGGLPPLSTISNRAMIMTRYGVPLVPNEYQTGLCDCFSDGLVCLDGFCCEWCQAGFQHTKVSSGFGGDMDPLVCAGLCCLDWLCCRGLAISCWTGLKGRPDVNRTFGIDEDFAITCLFGFCCTWCSICQQQREFKYRNYAAGGICDTTVHPLGPPLGAPPSSFPSLNQPMLQGGNMQTFK